MPEREKSYGLWDLIQTIFILYIVGISIKMIYLDAPRNIFDFLFCRRVNDENDDDSDAWGYFYQSILFYLIFLCLFFIFSLAGIAPLAAVALVISWGIVFVFRIFQRKTMNANVGPDSLPCRFWVLCVFLVKCFFAWLYIAAFVTLLCISMKLFEVLSLPIAVSGNVVLWGAAGGSYVIINRYRAYRKSQAA